jgi:glycosyltransferase involved in cell wall biosynthesis
MFTEGSLCRRCEGGNYTNAVRHRCFPSKAQAYGYATSLWIHRFLLRLEKKVDLFIVPSRFMRDQLHDWGINRTAYVPNYTEVPAASPSEGSYGLYFGRLSPEKGLDHLIAALKFAGDPPFQIVGDGPLEGKLKDMVAALGLKNTRMVGRVAPDELPRILQEARFAALPSVSHENAPLAALEAMAAARPLLVSDRGGLPELVEGGAGVICRSSDAQDLATKIRRMMEDPSFCVSAGERAVKRAVEEFSAEKHLERLETAYSKATSGGDPSPVPR